MQRRRFVALAGGTIVGLPYLVRAQQAGGLPRVGVLWHAGNPEEEAIYLGALREGLAELGYIDGKTIRLENRYAAEQYERFKDLAAELVGLSIDVLVAVTRPSALAARRATATIPIVFVVVPDPVGSKLVANLARPGGNITGLSNMAVELSGKRLELLREAVPGLSRVALLLNPNDREGARRYADESQAAAGSLGLNILPVEVPSPDDLDRAFSVITDNHAGGVVVPADGMFYNERRRITASALARRLPTMLYSRETAEAGGLMSYGPSHTAIFRRAAAYIDKILKGTKPGDIPVELPTRFELIVSLKVAEALGLKMPQTLLARADSVIE